MSISERLAQFIVDTNWEAIPPEAISQARRAILDTAGVALAGCHEEGSRIVANWARETDSRQEATVVGHGFRTAASEAALANGAFAHALDYDDVNISMLGHPSAPVVPAVLALGEKLATPGREVIMAFVLGFEVEAKVGRAAGGIHYAQGWHPTATLGSLGAAAAAAKLLRLDVEKAQMALGIAASLASGLRQNFGTMTKPLHAGLAARNGIVAASLAAQGFTADRQALEGPHGFLRCFTGEGKFQAEKAIEALGQPFDIVSPGIGVKLYPCCYATHRALDAALELRTTNGIAPRDIAKVEVRVNRGTLMPLIREKPATGLQGKFNLEYCLATALLDGYVRLDSFSDEAVRRPQAQELLSRVETIEEGEEPARPGAAGPIGGYAAVRLVLRDGSECSLRVEVPKGDPRRPLSWEELVAKFEDCAKQTLPPHAVERAVGLISGMEGLGDVRELMALLGEAAAAR